MAEGGSGLGRGRIQIYGRGGVMRKGVRHIRRVAARRNKRAGVDFMSTFWRFDTFHTSHSGVSRWFQVSLHITGLLGSTHRSQRIEAVSNSNIALSHRHFIAIHISFRTRPSVIHSILLLQQVSTLVWTLWASDPTPILRRIKLRYLPAFWRKY